MALLLLVYTRYTIKYATINYVRLIVEQHNTIIFLQVGVHSAKFSNEKNSKKLLSAVQRYNIKHPVVNDTKMSMWRYLGIVCWPTLVMLGNDRIFTSIGDNYLQRRIK